MSQITRDGAGIPFKITGDQFAATELEKLIVAHNDTDIRTDALEGSGNIVRVNSDTDFPTAVTNVITLADNTIYLVSGAINIGSDRLVMGSNTFLTGTYAGTDSITSTTAGAIVTATNVHFKFREIRIIATSSAGFDLNGTTAENALFLRCTAG